MSASPARMVSLWLMDTVSHVPSAARPARFLMEKVAINVRLVTLVSSMSGDSAYLAIPSEKPVITLNPVRLVMKILH